MLGEKKIIGFMQGRLCKMVGDRIQAFPWHEWQSEFSTAAGIDLNLMEWTLDQELLYENPLMTVEGREIIKALCQQHGVTIPSLTGDCFMQAPFWKAKDQNLLDLQSDFLRICISCAEIGIHIVVVPLVDNGKLDNLEQENVLVDFLLVQQAFLAENNLKIIFESDYAPTELARFIERLPVDGFGINYDIGNSAALGFDPLEEFEAYGSRVINVHIKDRLLHGTTVPLKAGAADFDDVFVGLARQNYQGNFILQTARALDGNHAKILSDYRDMTYDWIKKYGFITQS